MDAMRALFAAALLLQAPVPAPTPDVRLTEFCSLVRQCSLPGGAVTCPAEVSKGVDGVTYDADRCATARLLVSRGVTPEAPRHYALFRFLGRRYQVTYDVTGEAPISPARLAYLIEDLPLAARLLTHFQRVEYAAEYLDADHSRLKASRAGTLKAEAEQVSGSPREGVLYYYGYGTSQLGPWKLRGLALVEVRYQPAPSGRGLAYRIRIQASPANAVLNTFMNLGLFRSVLRGKVQDVLQDITEASRKLDRAGLAGVTSAATWSEDEKRRIAALLALSG
jgi:hypothetical protein